MRSYEKLILLSIATGICAFSGCGKPRDPTVATPAPQAYKESPFDRIAALVHAEALTDWGKIEKTPGGFPFIAPADAAAVIAAVRWAQENKIALRVRGRGHSMDGKSLPKPGELLVLTQKLNTMKKIGDDLIEVGSGVSLYAVNQWLSAYGRILPIHNDGIVGPSLGGFIAAGGIGRGSRHFGGFWNNVIEITFVDGTGKIHTINPGDPVFPWLFGSMGQLGIVLSAKLKLIPLEGKELKPLPADAIINEAWENDPIMAKRTHDSYRNEYLYWFSIFAPASEEKILRAELNAIKTRLPQLMKFLPEYYWPMKFFRFTPPLLFHAQSDFVCIGIWGHLPPDATQEQRVRNVLKLEEEVTLLLSRHPHFRRYIQSEVVPSAGRLNTYFSPRIKEQFSKLKELYDHLMILNRIDGFLIF
jgi:hypothetical protein